MSKKLKILFKAGVLFSFFYGLFVLLFLQEVAVFGDSFLKACDEKGVYLPLQDPNILVDVSDATLTISEGDDYPRKPSVVAVSGMLVIRRNNPLIGARSVE